MLDTEVNKKKSFYIFSYLGNLLKLIIIFVANW
jgi:hypothetical protein